jgi:hypothetical protein
MYYRHRLPNVNLQAVRMTDLAGNVIKMLGVPQRRYPAVL